MTKPRSLERDGASRITEPLKLIPKDRPAVLLVALFLLVFNDQGGKWLTCAALALTGGTGVTLLIRRLLGA